MECIHYYYKQKESNTLNSYRVWKIFNIVKGKITGVFPELKKLNGYTSAYGDWLDYREGPQASKNLNKSN